MGKFLFFLLFAASVPVFAVAQRTPRNLVAKDVTIDCEFATETDVFNPSDSFYACTIKTKLMSSLFNAIGVTGAHESGKSAVDVKLIIIEDDVEFFPQNLLEHFANIAAIKITGASFKLITKDDLEPFTNLKSFSIDGSPIEIIGAETFASNTKLEFLYLNSFFFFFIHENAFDGLNLLTNFKVTGLACTLSGTDQTTVATEIAKIKATCQNTAALTTRFESIVQEKAATTTTIDECRTEVSTKNDRIEILEEKERENDQLKTQINYKTTEIATLTTNLQTCKDDKVLLQNEIIRLEEKITPATGNCKLSQEPDTDFTCTARGEIELKANGEPNIVWDGSFLGGKTKDDVKTLKIDTKTFEILPRKVGESFKNLATFIVKSAQLKSLRKGDFVTLEKLTKLVINDNAIATVEFETFNPLTLLTHLDLTGNSIKTLPSRVFEKLTAVSHLDISSNEIKSLDENFVPLSNVIKHFYAKNNKLTRADIYLIWRLKNCEIIDLTGNSACRLKFDVADTITFANFNAFFLEIVLGKC